MRIAGVLAAAALSFVSLASLGTPARADITKAWAAAKAGLPADTKVVVGIDVAAIHKSQVFATYYPRLVAKHDAAAALDAMKAACKLDPLQVLQGVVIALGADSDDGAVYLSFAGTDRAKLSSCLSAAVTNNDKTAKVSVKNDGNVTEVVKDDTTSYFGWVGKDILVIPLKAGDKPSVARWTGGKGAFARSDAAKTLAKVNTASVIWFGGEKPRALNAGVEFKVGYGSIKYAGAAYDADVHAQMASADAATQFATVARGQLEQGKQFAAVQPALNAVLNAIVISTASDEVVIKAKVGEADLITALALIGP